MSRYSPWAEIAEHDVLVIRALLPSGYGWWVPEEKVIVLDERLTPYERRCTLAHELEHVLADDLYCGHGMEWFDEKAERRADRRAAAKLITLEQLLAARPCGRSETDLADELWVDVPTLRVRQSMLTEDEHAYINGWATGQDGAA